MALVPVWRAERVHAESLLLDAEGLFVAGYGNRKADYCSCSFHIWAADLARAEDARARILAKTGPTPHPPVPLAPTLRRGAQPARHRPSLKSSCSLASQNSITAERNDAGSMAG